MISQRHLFFNHIAQTSDAPLALEIDRADGIYLYDSNNKSYIDFIINWLILNHYVRNKDLVFNIVTRKKDMILQNTTKQPITLIFSFKNVDMGAEATDDQVRGSG